MIPAHPRIEGGMFLPGEAGPGEAGPGEAGPGKSGPGKSGPGNFWFWIAFVLLLELFAPSSGHAAPAGPPAARLALVIGEAAYAAGPLPTTANDAGLIAQALAETGFHVTGYADLSKAAIQAAVARFAAEAREAGANATVVVYVSGYGVQFAGQNYLVPIEASIARDTDVPAQALGLTDLLRPLEELPLSLRIAVVDLARAHPFAKAGAPLARGLTLRLPPAAMLEVYNAAPGTVVGPGQGDYGVFASVLAEEIKSGGVDLGGLLRQLRLRVAAVTDGDEIPFSQGRAGESSAGQAGESFAFGGDPAPPGTAAPVVPAPVASFAPPAAFWEALGRDGLADYAAFLAAFPDDPLAMRVKRLLAARREALTFAQSVAAGKSAAIWTYMRRYPRGPHFADARRLLAALGLPLEPPPRFEAYRFDDLPPPRPGEAERLAAPFVFLADADAAPVPQLPAAAVMADEVRFYDRLPPLLRVGAHALPLPFPRDAAAFFEMGRIVQPGDGVPVRAGQLALKTGRVALVQEGPDGKIVTQAVLTGSPEGSCTIEQTGPSGNVIWTITAADIHASKTLMQWGPDHDVRSVTVVQDEDEGTTTVTVADAGEHPLAVTTLDAHGMIQPPRDGSSRLRLQRVLPRPTVYEAVPRPKPAIAAPPKAATPKPILRPVAPAVQTAAPSGLKEPAIREPMIQEPVIQEPVVKEPTIAVPTITEPMISAPTISAPVVPQPGVKEPVLPAPHEPQLPAQPVTPAPPSRR